MTHEVVNSLYSLNRKNAKKLKLTSPNMKETNMHRQLSVKLMKSLLIGQIWPIIVPLGGPSLSSDNYQMRWDAKCERFQQWFYTCLFFCQSIYIKRCSVCQSVCSFWNACQKASISGPVGPEMLVTHITLIATITYITYIALIRI